MLKVTIEHHERVTVETAGEFTEDAAQACFQALLAAGHAPINVIEAFAQIAEDCREAWFPDAPN